VKQAVVAAVRQAAMDAESEAAGESLAEDKVDMSTGKKKKVIGGVAEEAELCGKVGKEYRRANDDIRAAKWEEKSSQIK
jgi:hypothetical protein